MGRNFAGYGVRCRAAALALLAATLCAACACAQRADPREPYVVRVGIGLGGTARENLRSFIERFVAEPLVSVAWDGRPVGRLAERWDWDADGLVLTITLRRGVRFHDGSALTSAAVTRFLDAQRQAGSLAQVIRITSGDDRTVRLHLGRPDRLVLSELMTLPVLDRPDGSIGTGPFRYVPAENHTMLRRFDEYHGGVPTVDGVEIRAYETQRSAWAAMLRGDIDLVQEVSRDAVEFIEPATTTQAYPFIKPYYVPVVFNLRHPVLRNLEVRRALSEAVDRESVLKGPMGGQGRVADGPIWPYHWANASHTPQNPYNPHAARLRLDAAGYPVRAGGDGMEARFRFTCIFWREDPQFERIALLLQRQFFEVGVDVRFEPVPLAELGRRMASGEFDAYLGQMTSGRSLDWTYAWWHSPEPASMVLQRSGYSGSDAVLERLRAARTDDAVRIAVSDLQRQMQRDVPALFLAWQQTTRAVDARLAIAADESGDILATLWRWPRPQSAGMGP